MAQLRADYVARLPSELAALSSLGESVRAGEPDRGDLQSLHHRLHKLAGTGGSFGLTELSAKARALERRVERWLDEGLDTIDDAAGRALVEDLGALHAAAGKTDPVLQSSFLPRKKTPVSEVAQIWLVEDDPEVGRQLRYQLESFNYSVRMFESIDEAGRIAETERPDLLILDVMFEAEGENSTEKMSRCPALNRLECPLLFVTSHDDFMSRVRAARLGAMGYFIKPIDVPRLVNRMAQIFDQRRAPPQRVLIVDDDADLAEHMRLVLMAQDIRVEVLSRPQDIMEEIAAFRPELVLMDMHMPEFSGPDLAGVIRQHENYANLPVVYLSAETDIKQQVRAMDRGADDFLSKPISDFQLVAAVRARIARARRLDEQISKDSLTGLLKHASIKEAVDMNVRHAHRVGAPITVAMLDIDHFKEVNDSYGHAIGDVVIAAVATLLRQRLRQSDIIGRYGGEEFVAVLPECDVGNAKRVLGDIRERFSSLGFSHGGQTFKCTISIGLASASQHPESDGAELLVTADEALFKAKRGGRNQVCEAKPA